MLLEEHKGNSAKAMQMAADLLRQDDRPGLNETLEFAELLRLNAANTLDNTLAAKLARRAWEIIAAQYGQDSPPALAAQRFMIQYADADSERLLTAQEARLRDAFGDDSFDYAEVMGQHCIQRLLAKDYAGAEGLCSRVVAIYEKTPEAEPTRLASAYDFEADALLRLDRANEALDYYERELSLLSATFAPTNVVVIQSRLRVAEARCRGGDVSRAAAEFESGISALVAEVGAGQLWESLHAARFATCLLDNGQQAPARAILEAHAPLNRPPKDMTEEDRTEVATAWQRAAERTGQYR